MKVLVTGANGLLGKDLSRILSRNHEVISPGKKELDITRQEATQKIMDYSPDFIFNLAAYTDVDGCEGNIQRAFEVNETGARHVALGALGSWAPLLHLSTDYLFDGQKKEPYKEGDSPNPLNVYGRSKFAGEEAIQEILKEYYIVRSSWLFGEGGRNFVDTILKLARENRSIQVVVDQVGSPTYSRDLSEGLVRLMERREKESPFPYGIYHISNSGSCSWFDFAKELFEVAGVEGCRLEKTDSTETHRPARRPPYSVLDNAHFQEISGFSLRSWKEALRDYIHQEKKYWEKP